MKYSRPWNICVHEISASMKYLRPWNICAHEISAPMKYLSPHEISTPRQGCSRLKIYNSNKANVAGRKCRRPDSYYLGSAESPTSDSFSVRLKSSLSDGVASPPCSPQVESAHRPAQLTWAASLPYCTGLLYRHNLPKCSRLSNVRGRGYCILTFFSGKNQKPNSAHKCPITSIQIRT